MHDLPSSTVTLLFTDIEGSTRLLQRLGGRYPALLAQHRDLLRGAFEAWGGHEVDAQGDSSFVAFGRALDAVAAAVAAQRALARHSWLDNAPVRVRMALHTGEPTLAEGNYVGLDVHRAARLVAAGHGGQVLLSRTTRDLVERSLPAGVDVLDLGAHRLKDLQHPEQVFQLVITDLPANFPPLRTLDSRPNNLPVQPTRLIGRGWEVEAARTRLLGEDVRLLTLTGPGGTGKTRLGLHLAANLLEQFEGGVFVVDLAPISDPGLVPSTIAQTVGVQEAVGRPLVQSLKESLQHKQLLLVLDNFEQVLGAAPLVADLLGSCPRLKVLVTSRAVLHLRGETEFSVPPLALPDLQSLPSAEVLSQYASVALFIERALEVRPEFAVTNENATAVAEVCARLDGLPLAIELAAARIRLLSPSAMLSRLDRRLSLLTGGARDLPARQQTLRATIAWSYDLLEPGEQRLFRRMAVFVGGCTLEAVETVCNAASDLETDVLDGVASLADKSLLRRDEREDGEPRSMMLETIREYALEGLESSGEADTLRRGHAEYYLALAEDAESRFWRGGDYGVWLDRLEREHDNLRAALIWSQSEARDAEMGLRLAGALWWFWFVHSHYSEGRRSLETMLSLSSDVPLALRVKALTGAGQLVRVQGDYGRGAALLEEAVALSRDLPDSWCLARALMELGFVPLFQGDAERATELWQESLTLARASGHTWGIATALHGLGRTAEFRRDYERAEAFLEESVALFRQLGNKWYTAWSLRYLGRVVQAHGDQARAEALLQESLALFREQDNKPGVAWALQNLGRVARSRGDYQRATALHVQSLALAREMGQKREIAECLEGLAELAVEQEPERAARLLGAAEMLREFIGAPLPPSERSGCERSLAAARANLSEEAFASQWAEGRASPLEQAVAYALERPAPN